MKKFLLTNDDGITSDGIVRLAREAVKLGEVWVVAPDEQRSAASHSITLRHAFEVWPVEFPVQGVHAYACNGMPGDCVRVGVLNLVPGKPDFVLSGINNGYNMASDLQYSATVGAAFEASFQGIQAIAFSEGSEEHHEVTDRFLFQIMQELTQKPLPEQTIWNVNFPSCKPEECGGVLRERIVSRDVFYQDHYDETVLEDRKISYRVVGVRKYEASPGTDLQAILENYVSIGMAMNIS